MSLARCNQIRRAIRSRFRRLTGVAFDTPLLLGCRSTCHFAMRDKEALWYVGGVSDWRTSKGGRAARLRISRRAGGPYRKNLIPVRSRSETTPAGRQHSTNLPISLSVRTTVAIESSCICRFAMPPHRLPDLPERQGKNYLCPIYYRNQRHLSIYTQKSCPPLPLCRPSIRW